jgi:Xaa-Pro aminopeptidase
MLNVGYLSGFKGSSGFILVAEDRNIFVTDFRYKETAEREFRDGWDVRIEKDSRIRTIRKLMQGLGIKRLGFESSVSYEMFNALNRCSAALKPLTGAVEGLRAEKDAMEIDHIKEAVKRAEDAFLDIRPYIRPGTKEKRIAAMLEERLKKRGCRRIPFDIIVASGVNSAMPHARATDKKLCAGDLIVIDWGGEAEGYCSDMTRTFLLRGEGASKKRRLYRTVLNANRQAIAAVRPHIMSRAIDNAARDIIKNAGYGEFFGHGTGHGIGLEVHETPHISWTKMDKIEQNMVFTIEPGVYIPGLGGVRIEDMVLVGSKEAGVLTKLPKDLEII